MCGCNLAMKFPLDFHNYQELNASANSFSYFTNAPVNILILGCKPHWSVKNKKKNILLEVVASKCSGKLSPWNFHKIYREVTVLESSFWRSRRPEEFCKKEVLENFAKFKGKHVWHILFFNKVVGLRLAILLKKGTSTGVSCEFSEISF